MFTRFHILTLGTAIALSATGAMAHETANGLSVNGLSVNGLSVNGLSVNGLSVNGLSVNGREAGGLAAEGSALQAVRPASLTLQDGSVVRLR